MTLRDLTFIADRGNRQDARPNSADVQQFLVSALDGLRRDDVLCLLVGMNRVWIDNFVDLPRHPEHWRVLLVEPDAKRAAETAAQNVDNPLLDIATVTDTPVSATMLGKVLDEHQQTRVDLIVLDATKHSLSALTGADLSRLDTRIIIATGGRTAPDAAVVTDDLRAGGFDVLPIDDDLIVVRKAGFLVEASNLLELIGDSPADILNCGIAVDLNVAVPPARPIQHGPIAIPRKIAHIWVGVRPAPEHWMRSWRDMHPDWDYQLYDNAFLTGRRWRTQALMTEYFARKDFEGVSDLMRYELLLEGGGVIAEADSVCVKPLDDLFPAETLYSVYENEHFRPGYLSPFIAAAPGQPMLEDILRDLGNRYTPQTLRAPWISTGNRFLGDFIAGREDEVVIFPSHYFNPNFKSRAPYDGDGPVYADQKWGSTLRLYDHYPADQAARIHEEVLYAL